jgi:hypothetical protein
MVDIFKKWNNQFLKVFVDDVNIHSGTWFEPLHHVQFIFQKLFEVNFKLNPSKCCFGSKNITFLGHVVDRNGSQLDLGKVAAITNFPMPKTSTNVKAFLGLTHYYRRFIVGYAKVAKPLFSLTKKECRFVWTSICQTTFGTLKGRLWKCPFWSKLTSIDLLSWMLTSQ